MLEVIFYSLVGGLFSLIGGVLLLRQKKSAHTLAEYATPFAAGVLLAAAFTDLLPEALHTNPNHSAVLRAALFGILGFFMLERFLGWFHHHHEHGTNGQSSNVLIIIGDTLHNAIDGVAIGAAFLISSPTGIVAATAVAAHEIPQEIGDFGLMLRNGMKKSKVLLVNALSALATTITAVMTYGLADKNNFPVAIFLAITAGFFIYIAASDIIPDVHNKSGKNRKDIRPWLLLIGAALIMIVSPIAHNYIDADNHTEETHETTQLHSD